MTIGNYATVRTKWIVLVNESLCHNNKSTNPKLKLCYFRVWIQYWRTKPLKKQDYLDLRLKP